MNGFTGFTRTITSTIENYIELQHSLGYAFSKQAATLHAFAGYVEGGDFHGPLTQSMVLDFVGLRNASANCRAVRYGVLRRFAEYLGVYDSRTQRLDARALPRSRAIPPARILSDQELETLLSACHRVSSQQLQRGRTLGTIIGLLASTGLRSGEALRLDRADVDLTEGILHVRNTKFRKNRLVPIHVTTLAVFQPPSDRGTPRKASTVARISTGY